ncbi:recombinase family protein [Streptomyces sp. NRRL S-378]|uniref:recombinase family protein n=1 Tax=Streptomyces sp. NRRL S-378 TaxID=1463904 RepID=UPI0004C6D49D|nr:recombinase family protein [Streptomyces sp. NRRL S-378]
MSDPVPAIGYVRVNTARVMTESDAQRAAIESWAARTGHLIVDWVEDILVPGEAGANDVALNELIERVQRGVASVVAVDGASRVSRNKAVYDLWVARLAEAGGSVQLTQ